MREVWKGEWCFRVRPARRGARGFIAWAKRGQLVGDGPMNEPGLDVRGTVASSEERALAELFAEVLN